MVQLKYLKDHKLTTSTQKGGGAVLKFVTCLWILLFLLFIFADGEGGRGGGVKKLVVFCVHHEWMTPKQFLENTSNVINCEISLILTWSKNCFLVAGTIANKEPKFTITDTNLM